MANIRRRQRVAAWRPFLDSELLCTARECIKPPETGLSAQSLGLNVGRPADVITPEPSATAYEPAPISLLV